MRNKSVLQEAQDIQKAVDLIRLGARMQMLEVETSISRERLLKLYKEVKGVSPPKGMLPFSTDMVHVLAAEHPCFAVHGALPFRKDSRQVAGA